MSAEFHGSSYKTKVCLNGIEVEIPKLTEMNGCKIVKVVKEEFKQKAEKFKECLK